MAKLRKRRMQWVRLWAQRTLDSDTLDGLSNAGFGLFCRALTLAGYHAGIDAEPGDIALPGGARYRLGQLSAALQNKDGLPALAAFLEEMSRDGSLEVEGQIRLPDGSPDKDAEVLVRVANWHRFQSRYDDVAKYRRAKADRDGQRDGGEISRGDIKPNEGEMISSNDGAEGYQPDDADINSPDDIAGKCKQMLDEEMSSVDDKKDISPTISKPDDINSRAAHPIRDVFAPAFLSLFGRMAPTPAVERASMLMAAVGGARELVGLMRAYKGENPSADWSQVLDRIEGRLG